MKKRPTALVLLSGGIDSAVTLYWAKKYKEYPIAVIFDYGQKHRKEINFAKKIAKLNKINYYLLKIPLNWAKSSLVQDKIKIPLNRPLDNPEIPSTYVPGRNLIFLSHAGSLAESLNVKKIFIGAHQIDYSNYPDCRPEFLASFEQTLNLGIKEKGINIIAPLINKNKKEIIELGISLGVPFHLTWSCYQGKTYPCLQCDSCRHRLYAFQKLGILDPLLKKRCRQK